MIIPVRCFTCGKIISDVFEDYEKRYDESKKSIKAGETPKEVLDDLGLERYCCRSAFLGQVDLLELTMKFKKA